MVLEMQRKLLSFTISFKTFCVCVCGENCMARERHTKAMSSVWGSIFYLSLISCLVEPKVNNL